MGKTANTRGVGAALENVVFYNSIPLFNKGQIKIDHKVQGNSNFMTQLCWWNPPDDALPVEFCRNSSMHGLTFIGRRNLHLSERLFWAIAFILGVMAAVFLINDVWQRYYQNPVIVAFQPHELDIDTIPFPSVTICSMNAFPRSEVQRLKRIARRSGSPEAKAAREALKYVREICHSQVSFAKEFQYAHNRGEEDMNLGWNDTIAEEAQNEMMEFLLKYTLPCENLIRLCIFAEKPVDCGTIFKPLITDYGKCCTFNILPLPLLLNHPQVSTTLEMETDSIDLEENPSKNARWSDEELEMWKEWNYDRDGFNLLNKSQPRPYRQKRAGMPYGLSILVDPNLDDWYCPVSDSEGIRFILHNSLEMPNVDEFASVMPLNQEIMVEIHPDVTNAEDDIRKFDFRSRNCYFPEDYQLRFYGPYTSGNCFAECTALALEEKCNCTYFYMPRDYNTTICNTDPQSNDHKCMDNAKIELLETLKTQCKHCESLCEDIEYHFETTTATLQDALKLWSDPNPKKHPSGPPSWAKNKMSIIHIFLGSETVVPKMRQLLYGTTDLIASTGGLLALCLGFSILSAMEVVYFFTLRAFWKIYRKKLTNKNKELEKSKTKHILFPPSRERIIHLNPNQIPLFYNTIQHSWTKHPSASHPYQIAALLMEKKEL